MGFWHWARWGLGPAVGVASLAWGQSSPAPVLLPPVTVPLPPSQPAPESPSQRDPTGQSSVVELGGRRGEVLTTGELVSQVPGALVNSTGGLGQAESISLRGAPTGGVLVLLDGIPLNGAGDIADLSLVPTSILERAEVLRGGAGARYGPLALGGVVNLVTRSPDQAPPAFADATLGSFGTWRASLGGAGQVLGGSGLAILHAGHSEGNFTYTYQPLVGVPEAVGTQLTRSNNQSTSGGGLVRGAWEVSGWTLSALVEATFLSRGLPGTEDNPTPDASQSASRLLASVRSDRVFSDGTALDLRLDVRRTTDNLSGGTFGTGENDLLWQSGASADLSMTLGAHVLTGSASVGFAAVSATAGSPTWVLSSLSLQDEWSLFGGRASLVPAVRLDQTGPFWAVSPKVGASVQLPAGFSTLTNVGFGFRPPSFYELYLPTGTLGVNPDLQPERSFYVDGALAHATRWSRASLGGFWVRYQDLIVYEYTPPFFARPENVGLADAWGLEAEARLAPWPWLEAAGSYTLQWTVNLRDVAPYFGQELPYRPRQLGWARLAGGPDWLRLHLEVQGRSVVTVNRSGDLTLPGHVFVGAGVEVVVLPRSPRLSAAVQVTNVFDVQGQDLDGYPLPGRAVYATLSLALGEGSPGATKGR